MGREGEYDPIMSHFHAMAQPHRNKVGLNDTPDQLENIRKKPCIPN